MRRNIRPNLKAGIPKEITGKTIDSGLNPARRILDSEPKKWKTQANKKIR